MRLLAKSQDHKPFHPSMSLLAHLQDVHTSAQRVLDSTENDQLSSLGLPAETYRERFRRIVLLSAACHDLGKANDHFQGMIYRRRNVQGLRHEWVSLLILQDLKEWLRPAIGEDLPIVEWAVAGHHPAWNHASPPTEIPEGAGATITSLTAYSDFQACLSWLGNEFGLTIPPLLKSKTYRLVGGDSAFATLKRWEIEQRKIFDKLSPLDKRLAAAAKNVLVASDAGRAHLESLLDNDLRLPPLETLP